MDVDAFMLAAIAEAETGLREGGIPIGSVLVHDGRILGRGHNRRVQQKSPTLHGEMDALERAGRQPAAVYRSSILYTTLSPCAMRVRAKVATFGLLWWLMNFAAARASSVTGSCMTRCRTS